MGRVSRIQTAFNAGVLSPLVLGRPDLAKYGPGLKTSINGLSLIQGPISKRGGFRYLGSTKENGKVLLMDFVRTRSVAYILEFGEKYLRFWTKRGQVLWESGSNKGSIYEIQSPFALANLFDERGLPKLRGVQSGDILYLACADMPPQKLMFKGTNNWVFEEMKALGGPWQEPNKDKELSISVSGDRDGTVTLTASSAIFTSGHVGSLLRLEIQDLSDIPPWGSGQQWAEFEYCRNDGNTYLKTAYRDYHQWSGFNPPVHTKGREWDGSGKLVLDGTDAESVGLQWEYRDSGYGVVRITGVSSSKVATARVVTGYELPDFLMGKSTWIWQFGAWSKAGTFPSCCTIHRERLVFGGGIRVWFSKAADFENFEDKTFGVTGADNAVTTTVVTEQGVDSISGLTPLGSLVVSTGGGQVIISEATTTEPFGPENIRVVPYSSYGGEPMRALKVGSTALFVQAGGRKLREIDDLTLEERTSLPDMTILAEHITAPRLVDCAYQQEPYSIAWYALQDGRLVGFTRDKTQDVMSWHEHRLGGGAKVEAVECIPSHDRPEDELYLVARLDVGADDTRRFVCCLDPGMVRGGSLENAFFLDCGKTIVSATPIKEVPSLEHLEGLEVDILADGGTHKSLVVTDGKITMDTPAKTIQVGLGYDFLADSMPIEAGAQNGTAQGAKKLFRNVILRVFESAGGEIGDVDSNTWQSIFSRDFISKMDNPVDLITADLSTSWPAGWNTQGRMGIRQRQPFPLTVLAVIFVVETSDH